MDHSNGYGIRFGKQRTKQETHNLLDKTIWFVILVPAQMCVLIRQCHVNLFTWTPHFINAGMQVTNERFQIAVNILPQDLAL